MESTYRGEVTGEESGRVTISPLAWLDPDDTRPPKWIYSYNPGRAPAPMTTIIELRGPFGSQADAERAIRERFGDAVELRESAEDEDFLEPFRRE